MRKILLIALFTTLTLTIYSQNYLLAQQTLGLNADQLQSRIAVPLQYKYQEAPTFVIEFTDGVCTFMMENGLVAKVIFIFANNDRFNSFININSKFWTKIDNSKWKDSRYNSIIITRELFGSEDINRFQNYIEVTKIVNSCKLSNN